MGQSKVYVTHNGAWRVEWVMRLEQSAKQARHQTGIARLDEQSQVRWWANGDITCSGMHHESWGKMHLIVKECKLEVRSVRTP